MKRILLTESIEDISHLMSIYGLQQDGNKSFIADELVVTVSNPGYSINNQGSMTHAANVCELIDYLDKQAEPVEFERVTSATKCYTASRWKAVLAAISSKNLTDQLIRVKSSNIWAYAMNIRDRKDRTGDIICQFKNSSGGPGDIYIYYDVPITLWKKWQSAPSAGHFFWQYIRNNFKYAKLTGDRKGKLINAVN